MLKKINETIDKISGELISPDDVGYKNANVIFRDLVDDRDLRIAEDDKYYYISIKDLEDGKISDNPYDYYMRMDKEPEDLREAIDVAKFRDVLHELCTWKLQQSYNCKYQGGIENIPDYIKNRIAKTELIAEYKKSDGNKISIYANDKRKDYWYCETFTLKKGEYAINHYNPRWLVIFPKQDKEKVQTQTWCSVGQVDLNMIVMRRIERDSALYWSSYIKEKEQNKIPDKGTDHIQNKGKEKEQDKIPGKGKDDIEMEM